MEFERTQKPRGLTCCCLRHIDAKSRPHHRAKYGRGGSGISRVTTLTVSPIWIFWRGLNCQIAAHTATAESTHRRLRTQRIGSCQRVFPTIVRSMTVQGSVLVEIRRYEHRSLRSARASPNFEVRSAWGNRAIYPDALYSMWQLLIRPHRRAKYGRGGIDISGVMILTVSRHWFFFGEWWSWGGYVQNGLARWCLGERT